LSYVTTQNLKEPNNLLSFTGILPTAYISTLVAVGKHFAIAWPIIQIRNEQPQLCVRWS